MSVSLHAAKLYDLEDSDSVWANLSNRQWLEMTSETPDVETWNGYHDRVDYTPNDLRKIAKAHPSEADWLIELADNWGGAVLS